MGYLKTFTGQLAAIIIAFIAFVIVTDRLTRGITLDLTEDDLYTLSAGTYDILESLEEPVQLDLYISSDLATPYPGLLAWSKRIEDILIAMDRAVPGALDVSVIDPEPFSAQEDEAVAAGLRGVPLSDGTTLYLGLAARNLVDGRAAIPFFAEDREAFLEYDIIKLILSLGESEKPSLGLLTGLPMQFGLGGPQAMMQGQSAPFVLYDQLTEFFDVRSLNGGFDTLDGLDAVLIVHPDPLDEEQLYLLDQYALSGGRLAIFVDPHVESLNPQSTMPVSSSLSLLDHWGLTVDTGRIVGDLGLAQRVQMGGNTPSDVKDYLFWLAVRGDSINGDDIATGTVKQLNLASAGAISQADDSPLTEDVLISSSKTAMLYDAARAVGVPDPDGLIRELEPTGIAYPLLARYRGTVTTAYGEKAAETGGISSGEMTLLLGTDADMFFDRYWVQVQTFMGQRLSSPFADNGGLVLNLLDHLVGSEALLSLRTRGVAQRPFTVVNDIRKAAEERYLAEEQALSEELSRLEANLAELEAARSDSGQLYSAEQEAEIEQFRTSLVDTRRALRDVKGSLRQDIDDLGTWLAFINTALVPFIILILGLFLPRLLRKRRSSL